MKDPEKYQKLIARLAGLKGVEPEYKDNWGHLHATSTEVQRQILSAMGYRLGSLEEIEAEILEEELQNWKKVTNPLLIFSIDARPKELVFQLPVKNGMASDRLPADLQIQIRIKKESGDLKVLSFPSDRLLFRERTKIGGDTYLRGSLPFAQRMPLGYHTIFFSLSQAGRHYEQTIRVIVCPNRAYLPSGIRGKGKKAGVSFSLATLRSKDNWGIGDLGDLKELVRWTILFLHVDVIGLLPLHALFNREPHHISPYYPSSRFYRNPIYLNIPEIEEFDHCPEARKNLAAPETQNLIKQFRASEIVQFERVYELKRKILKLLFQTFCKNHRKRIGQETPRQKQFLSYVEGEGDLLDRYALYCVLEDHFRKEAPALKYWGQWPLPFRYPESMEVKSFRKEYAREVLFYKYLQWQLEMQLSEVQELARSLGAEIGLYHDLALGIDPWGADSWAWEDFTIPGFRVGAPPDAFSPEGQDWGFYPANQKKTRENGYRFFTREIRKNSLPGGALRIDHIMKYARLFWILEGHPPDNGVYVKYPLKEYLKVLALESIRNKTLIIGEDLGTIPETFRWTLEEYGIFSYRLFYFEKDEAGNFKPPNTLPELSLASISTHDLPPLKAFWSVTDLILRKNLGLFPDEAQFRQSLADRMMDKKRMIENLRQYGFLSEEEALELRSQVEPRLTEELHRAVMAYLVSTRAKLAVLSLEDLLGEGDQLNLPGTTIEYPNWSRKMRFSLEELRKHPEALRAATTFRDLVDQSGRGIKKLPRS
jgi:4-alpha-glucanotransferase